MKLWWAADNFIVLERHVSTCPVVISIIPNNRLKRNKNISFVCTRSLKPYNTHMPTLKNPYKPKIKRIPVTREGFEKLKKTLSELQKSRPEAVNNLSTARAMGDLSENGLYTAAKARLRSIDSQMFRLEIQIKLADIIESNNSGVVSIDSKVVVSDGVNEKTFHIVGDYEANPLESKISQHSPLGRALIGKKVGDTANFYAPKGLISYKILSIV